MTHPTAFSPSLCSVVLLAMVTSCAATAPATAPAPAPSPVPSASAGVVAPAGTGAPDAGASATPGVALPAPTVRFDRQLLTREEMRKSEFTNLYEIIRALRGNWLRVRAAEGMGKSSELVVYLDMQRIGTVDELRTISPVNIVTVRFFDPIQASARWGMDHGAGALLVTTAKR